MKRLTMTEWREARAPGFDGALVDHDADVIAIGDVHGRGEALTALVDELALRPRPKRRTLVFTGDMIDRGDKNIMATQAALLAGERLGAQETVFIAGNHELMMLDAVRDPTLWHPWYSNGGSAVLEEAGRHLGIEVHRPDMIPTVVREAFPKEWLAAIEAAPTHVRIGQALFVHAGVDPADMEGCLAFRPDEHRNDEGTNRRHPAWIRQAFLEHEDGWQGLVVIHGHTPALGRKDPVNHAGDVEDAMDRMRFGRINIDAGAATNNRVGFCQLRGNSFRIGVMEA